MKKQKPLLSLEPKDQNVFEEKIQAFKSKQRAKSGLVPGVIFIGHIPHGFYEEEMQKYFSQFGKVLRVRLARSRKTGGSRGFAFVEFECDEVAKIVADTMNNYLMFDKILKCEFISPERVQPGFFRGWRLGQPLAHAVNRMAQNKTKTRHVERNNLKRRLAKLENLKEKLSSIGVTYDLPVELPEKREVHSKLPKTTLKAVKNPVPLKKGTLLKGKRSIDEAVQVNTKSPSNDTDEGRAHRRLSSVSQKNGEFYTADKKQTWINEKLKSQSKTQHGGFQLWKSMNEDLQTQQDLETSVSSEKSSFRKKRKSSHFENNLAVQSAGNVQRKNSSQPRSPNDQSASGTPGKFMLVTADDVASFNTYGRKKRKSHDGSLKIDELSGSQPSPFRPKSDSSKDSARMKKGKRRDVVKTSTPMPALVFSDTSADDSSRYTLEIDTSENEITVKTPPKAIKKIKSKNKWQKQNRSLSFGKSSNFSVSEISQKSPKFSKYSNSGWNVSVK